MKSEDSLNNLQDLNEEIQKFNNSLSENLSNSFIFINIQYILFQVFVSIFNKIHRCHSRVFLELKKENAPYIFLFYVLNFLISYFVSTIGKFFKKTFL